ncbi:MAG: hypothetical protein LBU91_08290, partial [Bacteroidales bacterium]|nr:hypothetical protein [Bacteroidales bacterium]
MFKNSFFYRYLSPFAGTLALNVLFRMLSVLFNMALLLGVIPFLSILFGQVDGAAQEPVSANSFSESILNVLKYELSQFMAAHGKEQTLTLVVVTIAVFYILKNLFGYLALYTFMPIKNGTVRDIRRDLYNHLLILPLSFFSKQQKGDLLARVT